MCKQFGVRKQSYLRTWKGNEVGVPAIGSEEGGEKVVRVWKYQNWKLIFFLANQNWKLKREEYGIALYSNSHTLIIATQLFYIYYFHLLVCLFPLPRVLSSSGFSRPFAHSPREDKPWLMNDTCGAHMGHLQNKTCIVSSTNVFSLLVHTIKTNLLLEFIF